MEDPTVFDQGERRSVRTAEQELKERTLFYAEVEHKVKTALSVVQGWAVTLDERWDVMSTDARREGIAIVRRAADSLVAQAEGLLEEAKAELHSLELAPEMLDLAEVLHQSARARRAPKHTIVVDEAGPVWVRADPTGLQQVLGHLIENAVKYSPSGGQITLRVRGDGTAAVLEVQDEGVGLPEGGAERIFEPFHRGGSPDRSKPGVGLGLYIVRKLVEAMGGTVAAAGKPGAGSTFTVRLPLA